MKHLSIAKKEPFYKFLEWVEEEGFDLKYLEIPFVLSTVSKDLKPNSRVVFLKKIKDEKFIFFTNKNSQKGKDIDFNNAVSMCFYFKKSNKQIRIEGDVFLGNQKDTEEYFFTRSKISQIGALFSKQSEILPNYEDFLSSVKNYDDSKEIKCPDYWVNYEIKPEVFEFWEGRDFRLHLRKKYKKDLNFKNSWNLFTLYP